LAPVKRTTPARAGRASVRIMEKLATAQLAGFGRNSAHHRRRLTLGWGDRHRQHARVANQRASPWRRRHSSAAAPIAFGVPSLIHCMKGRSNLKPARTRSAGSGGRSACCVARGNGHRACDRSAVAIEIVQPCPLLGSGLPGRRRPGPASQELTTATASISIMKSGLARRVTPTVVLVGVATPR
jgi:hypothetical protein